MRSFQNILVRGIVWKLLFYIITFFLNLVIANQLGAAESGVFLLLLTNLSVITLILSFGLESSINYFNSRNEFSTQYLLSFCISWCLALLFLLIIGFSAVNLAGYSFSDNSIFLIFYILGSLLTGFLSAFLYSSNDSRTPNIIPSAINLFLIVFLLAVVDGSSNDSLLLFKNIYLVSSAITGLWLLFYFLKEQKTFSFKLTFHINKRIVHYSAQIFLTNLFVNLLFKIDIWLVSSFSTDYELGNYLQATKFSQFVFLLPNLASFTLFPLITKSVAENEKVELKLLSLVNLYFYLSLFICLAILSSGFWLFPELYGASFDRMYYIFIFLIPGLLSMAGSYPMTPYFSSIDSNRVTMTAAIYSILVLIAVGLLLVPTYAGIGAALASSCAYTFYFLILLFRFKKHWSFSVSSIFQPQKFYKSLRVLIASI